MVYDDSEGHSQHSTVNGPLIMHTMLSATHRFSSNRLLDTFWPMDKAKNTHRFAVVPMIATSSTWTTINEVVVVQKSLSKQIKNIILLDFICFKNVSNNQTIYKKTIRTVISNRIKFRQTMTTCCP